MSIPVSVRCDAVRHAGLSELILVILRWQVCRSLWDRGTHPQYLDLGDTITRVPNYLTNQVRSSDYIYTLKP